MGSAPWRSRSRGTCSAGSSSAGLVGGILELDANNNAIPAGSNTAVAQRIPYFAIEGGFAFAGLAGFTIRFGLSSLGPLQAFISVDVPGGILLDPDSGLTINDFSAGIEFNQTVSDICGGSAPATPMSLSSCTMPSATSGTAAQWLTQLQQQIVAQAKSGTTWATAFSQPMLIVGSAEIYSIYTSQQLFNAKVSLAFSTDGQILIEGQLNFADNQLSLGAYLYANLTQISSGTLNIMFLANIPQQIQIVQIYGQLQMGFENDAGQAIVYHVTGQTPAASTQLPSVPTASLAAPVDGQTLSQADLNGEGWVDVTYPSFGGEPVDPTSVENASKALLLTDANTDTLAVAGQPVLINASTNTFRYFFSGYTQPLPGHTNTVNVTFEGGWDNTAGVPWCAAGSTTCTPNANPTASTPVFGTWLDVTLASPAGDSVQSTPTSSEITLSGGGVGSVVPYTGTAPVVQVGTDTYRFLYAGVFGTGQVNVAFNSAANGGFNAVDGNGNVIPSVASSGSFTLIAPAQNFYIQLSGGLNVFVPGLGPAIQESGVVKLTVNPSPLVIQLTFSGQMTVIELGTLGATAGDFILDLGPSGPNLWGVATVSASYPGLVAAGIILTASGTLEINTSSQVQNVTLQLPTGPGGAEQAAPYVLQPTSLEIAVTGQAALRPPGTSTDLLDLTGGFYIGINPQGLQIYAVATLSVGGVQLGQATGLILISSGKGVPGIPGIAGLLTVGGSASLGLPDVGNLFSITGTATVMFNTTLADQTFQIPAEFLALQPAGDPTTVTVYGAAPTLTGQPNVGAAPSIYASITINAQLTLGGVITFTGFIQIQAVAGAQGAELEINGAVSASISFLGSLTGQINLYVFVSSTPGDSGVVGRIALTRNANGIPGVQLDGEFMVEINTFQSTPSGAVTIQTYALFDTANDVCTDGGLGSPCTNGTPMGYETNAAGFPITTGVAIPDGTFAFYMFGNITIEDLVTVTATVSFSIQTAGSDPGVQLTVNGTIGLGPLGVLTLNPGTGFRIDKNGLLANISISLNAGFGGNLGLSFNATAQISINTSSATQTLDGVQIPSGFMLAISGDVTFAGFATASGSVTVTINASEFQLTFAVNFAIGPLDFSANGGAGIYNNGANDTGIALELNVNLSINATVFSINASGLLEINTTGTSNLGINPHSFILALNGQISLLQVLNFNASITIAVSSTTLSTLQVGPVTIPAGTTTGGWYFEVNASVNFFGIATLQGAIYLDADGDFTVSLSGGITIGSSSFGLSGGFTFLITSQHDDYGGYRLEVSGSANVSVNAFGISLAGIGVSFDVCASTSPTYQCPSGYTTGGGSTPLTLSIHISVSFLFFTISGTAHFTLGYIQLPQPVYLAGDNTDSMTNAQQWTPTSGVGQPLYLNVGQYQSYRNIGTDATSDTYEISQVGGSAGDATIQVTAFGRTEQFSDVSSVVANWSGQDCAGGCQMFVDVAPGVTVPVTITGGPGENIIDYEGSDKSGSTTIYGGSGTNIITDSGTGVITIDDSGAGQAGQIEHSGPGRATIVSGN